MPWACFLLQLRRVTLLPATGAPARQPVWGLHSTERVGCTRRALLIYGLNSIRPFPKRVAADSPRLSPRLTVCRSPARRRFRTEHLRTTSRRSRRARVNGVVSTPPSEQRIANASTGSSSRTNPFLLKYLRKTPFRLATHDRDWPLTAGPPTWPASRAPATSLSLLLSAGSETRRIGN